MRHGKDTLTSALGPKGPQIETMALQLLAVLEDCDDYDITSRAWEIADQLHAARNSARAEAGRGRGPVVLPINV